MNTFFSSKPISHQQLDPRPWHLSLSLLGWPNLFETHVWFQEYLSLAPELKQHIGWHLDIMDGHFVPNLTWGEHLIRSLPKDLGPFDTHLMVTNPSDYIEKWADLNVGNVTFHWEAVQHQDRLIQRAKELYKEVSIAINPGTPWQVIPDYLLCQVDRVLIMTVNPGFAGQKFIQPMLEKVGSLWVHLQTINSKAIIQVDGGVRESNLRLLYEQGARDFVVGSWAYECGDIDALIKKIYSTIN